MKASSDRVKNVHLSYIAQVKKRVGKSAESIEFKSPCTIQGLISDTLCERYPRLREYVLEESGAIKKIILIFIGEDKVDTAVPLELNDGDKITIMSPITGG